MTHEGSAEPGEITRILHDARDGSAIALREALTLLHDNLRWIARRQLAGEREGHTLETDGLVHEAFLRMEGLDRIEWRDRQHVLSMAARTMRRVLLDYADHRRAAKRGGGDVTVTLGEAERTMSAIDANSDALHALDEALERLAMLNPRLSEVVEHRFFLGLSIEETAKALERSPATVKRDWHAARAWLNAELTA